MVIFFSSFRVAIKCAHYQIFDIFVDKTMKVEDTRYFDTYVEGIVPCMSYYKNQNVQMYSV